MISEELALKIAATVGALGTGVLAWLRFRPKDRAETLLAKAQASKETAEADSIALNTAREALAAWNESLDRLRALESTRQEQDRKIAELAMKYEECEEHRASEAADIAPLRAQLDKLRTRVRELERHT